MASFTVNLSIWLLIAVAVFQWLGVNGITCYHGGGEYYGIQADRNNCLYTRDDMGYEFRHCDTCLPLNLTFSIELLEVDECYKIPGYQVIKRCITNYCNKDPCTPSKILLFDKTSAPETTPWEEATETTETTDSTTLTLPSDTARVAKAYQVNDTTSTPLTSSTTETYKNPSMKASNELSNTSKGIEAPCETILSTLNNIATNLTNTLSNFGLNGDKETTNGTWKSSNSSNAKTGGPNSNNPNPSSLSTGSPNTGGQTGTDASSVLNPGGSSGNGNTANGETSNQSQHNNQDGSSRKNHSITGSPDNPPNVIRYLPSTSNQCDCSCNHKSKAKMFVTQGASSINVMMLPFLTLLVYLF